MQPERRTKARSWCYVSVLYSHTATPLTPFVTLLGAPPAPTASSLPHQLGVLTQLLIPGPTPDPLHPQTAPDPAGSGLGPAGRPLTLDASRSGPHVTHSSEWATHRGFPGPSHRGVDSLLLQLTELRETLVFITLLKGRNGPMMASVGGGRGETRAQDHHRSPWIGGHHSPGTLVCSRAEKLPKPLGCFMEASS